jgi:NAD(P)-dependent dehydrogenase (short-subunit alcohol dehydrogenase family)
MTVRTFLVTGASKGIGRALSHWLADAGHHVVGVARSGNGPDFPGDLIAVDLSDRAATDQALKDLVEKYDFDGVVNNVGFIRLGHVGEIDLDDLEHQLLHNLIPSVQTVQALLPGMRKRGWGRVVNVSSLVALGGHRHRTGYAGAKAAMISFTRSWALELAATGITVNSVAPGPTETELFRANTPVGSEAEQRFLSMVPMGRFGRPSELAAAIAFLLSEDAGFITGQTLFVDGGASIGRQSI